MGYGDDMGGTIFNGVFQVCIYADEIFSEGFTGIWRRVPEIAVDDGCSCEFVMLPFDFDIK